LAQLKSENVKRETLHAQERAEGIIRQDALFLSIKDAIMKDEDVRVEEKRKEMDTRSAEKEQERVALSKMRSDICQSANSILGLKTKSMVRLMEQLRWKREMEEQLIVLSKDIGECHRGFKQVRKARREVQVDGRGHGIAVIPTATVSHRPSSPDVSLQGLPTPAPSQSPPPHEVTSACPLKQVATTGTQTIGTNVGPVPQSQVKQEETSFDLQRAEPLETKARVRIGSSNDGTFFSRLLGFASELTTLT
jgi:hypothetical protein